MVGTEHLLLGLLRTPESAGGRVLKALGMSQRQVRKSIVGRLSDEEPAMVGQIRPDHGSRQALDLAVRESENAGRGSVGPSIFCWASSALMVLAGRSLLSSG